MADRRGWPAPTCCGESTNRSRRFATPKTPSARRCTRWKTPTSTRAANRAGSGRGGREGYDGNHKSPWLPPEGSWVAGRGATPEGGGRASAVVLARATCTGSPLASAIGMWGWAPNIHLDFEDFHQHRGRAHPKQRVAALVADPGVLSRRASVRKGVRVRERRVA